MGAQDGPEDGQDRQGMEGDMMMEFSKVIEIACDKCGRREAHSITSKAGSRKTDNFVEVRV